MTDQTKREKFEAELFAELREHKLHNTIYEEGDHYSLIDSLTPPKGSIDIGIEELKDIVSIAGSIWQARAAIDSGAVSLERARARFDAFYDAQMPEEIGNRFHAYWIWLTALGLSDPDYKTPSQRDGGAVSGGVIEIPDDIRIPLHSLQADLGYLLERHKDPDDEMTVHDRMSELLGQIETAVLNLVNYGPKLDGGTVSHDDEIPNVDSRWVGGMSAVRKAGYEEGYQTALRTPPEQNEAHLADFGNWLGEQWRFKTQAQFGQWPMEEWVKTFLASRQEEKE